MKVRRGSQESQGSQEKSQGATGAKSVSFRKKSEMIRLLSIVLLACLIMACEQPAEDSASLLVGSSAVPINPPAGSFIAGDQLNRRFAGVHDSLFAKAVVISDENNHVAILTIDCIGLLYPALEQIREAVATRLEGEAFDPAHIVMTSTHTHSGPDVVGLWGPDQLTSGVDGAYMERLISISAEQIERAWRKRQSARVRYAETTHGEGWVYNISEPGELDRALTILQFTDLEGKPVATLTNFACHPTFMDAAGDLVSADFVGGLYRRLDAALGGTNLFLQGAIGGWVQPEGQEQTFENADSKGIGLANAVLKALEEAAVIKQTDIHFYSKIFQMPVSNPGFRQLSQAGVIKRELTDSVTTEIAYFSIGDAQFITHPGETCPAHSLASKALLPGDGPKFVIGLGMDALGYIVKPGFFDPANEIPHSAYLTRMSVDTAAGPVMMGVIEEMVRGR